LDYLEHLEHLESETRGVVLRPHISVFGNQVPVYGLLMVVAGAVAWLVIMALTRLTRAKNWADSSDASLTYLIGISGGVTGAFLLRPIIKMFEVAIGWQRYDFAGISGFFNYIFGEIVFYGGFIGGLVAILLFCRKFKIKIVPLFDIFAPALALAHAIGRVGCFFAGCCFGVPVPYNHPFSVVYPTASLGAPPGISLLAAPLLEASFLLILFIALAILCLVRKKPGLGATVYLLVYPVGRFILEYFRGDIIRGNYGLFTTSQIISVLVLAFGVVYYLRVRRIAIIDLS